MLEVRQWGLNACATKRRTVRVDYYKYLGSQVAADGGCERDLVHRMNEGYRAWGALKSVLSNRGLGIKTNISVYMKKKLFNGVVRSRGMGYEKC